MFGDVLFVNKGTVLSKKWQDLHLQFIHYRSFGFNQMRHGNLALWNPYIYSGMPFMGDPESALLYLPNLIYLILSLPKAVNFDISIHIFLIGFFMYLWVSHRHLHPLACLLSSILMMFSGAYFLHVCPGHLTVLSTTAWTPLLFLSIDGLFENRSPGWCLLGIFAVTMQILGGYPQHVFYTAVAVAVYSGFCIIKAPKRTIIIMELAGIYIGAAALSSVQLLTSFQAVGESVRSGAMPYEFASHFSLPPENLITLIAPTFFGNVKNFSYWGRCFLWEMSLFTGITGLVLAIYGSVYGTRNVRRFSVPMVLILILLALGGHTPLFRILYAWVPGFNKFRSNSKFIFQASLFMVMLSGIGMDCLIRRGKVHGKTTAIILAAGMLTGIAALYIRQSALTNTAGLWEKIIRGIHATGETLLRPNIAYTNAWFIKKAGVLASKSLIISSGTFLLLSAIFFLTRFSKRVVYVVAFLAVIEIFIFARISLCTFDFSSALPPDLKTFSTGHTGDYRLLCTREPNAAMSLRMHNICGGAGAIAPKRYAKFMAFTQGHDPDEVPPNDRCSRYHRLYSMLRCRYLLLPRWVRVKISGREDVTTRLRTVGSKMRCMEFDGFMERLHLLQDYVVITDPNQILKNLEDVAFDPHEKVILEASPYPEPEKSGEKGTARIIDSSTDHLTIEADLPHPSLLLITDTYSSGWRARALRGSIQKKYDLIPANYILRAIPLSKGYHHLRVEYLPAAFQIGKWISIISAVIYLAAIGWCWRIKHTKSPEE